MPRGISRVALLSGYCKYVLENGDLGKKVVAVMTITFLEEMLRDF
jgi:hypothetical protein